MFAEEAQIKASYIGLVGYIYWRLSLCVFSKPHVLAVNHSAFYLFKFIQNSSGMRNLFFFLHFQMLEHWPQKYLFSSWNIDFSNGKIHITSTFRRFPSPRLGWLSGWITFLYQKTLKCCWFSWTDWVSNKNWNRLYNQKMGKPSIHWLI